MILSKQVVKLLIYDFLLIKYLYTIIYEYFRSIKKIIVQ